MACRSETALASFAPQPDSSRDADASDDAYVPPLAIQLSRSVPGWVERAVRLAFEAEAELSLEFDQAADGAELGGVLFAA
jgi:hypothetical protein